MGNGAALSASVLAPILDSTNRLGHATTHYRFCRVVANRNAARGRRIPIDFADGDIVPYR